jgi:hypothetical protein
MKLSELKPINEWNVGALDVNLDVLDDLELDDGDILVHFTTSVLDGIPVVVYWDKSIKPSHRFILAIKGHPIGEILTQHLKGGEQIISSLVKPSYRGKQIIENAYAAIVSASGLTIISGDQLSKPAEKIWLKLQSKCKIYDAKLDKFYELSDIGEMTSDDVVIISPKEDKSVSHEAPRFHLALVGLGVSHQKKIQEDLKKNRPAFRNTSILESITGKINVSAGVSRIFL